MILCLELFVGCLVCKRWCCFSCVTCLVYVVLEVLVCTFSGLFSCWLSGFASLLGILLLCYLGFGFVLFGVVLCVCRALGCVTVVCFCFV